MKILTMIPSMSANSNPYLPKVLKELKDISDKLKLIGADLKMLE